MTIISREPGDNIHEILANWFTPGEMSLIHAEEIPGGMSGSRLWRVLVGERKYCLRRTPGGRGISIGDLIPTHAFLDHLWNEGFRDIACPVKNLQQGTFVEKYSDIWEISNFLPGEATKTPTLAQALAAVKYLARLHVAAASYQIFPPRIPHGMNHRREICQELRRGKLAFLSTAIEQSISSSERDFGLRIISQIKSILPNLIDQLEDSHDKVPVQWCLIDCHIGNFLFVGENVTGIVDFATSEVDSVSRDVARLIGSINTQDRSVWRTCLNCYQTLRPLTGAELQMILAYHNSGLVGTAANWLEWRYISCADFADAGTTQARLEQLSTQLAAIPDIEAVFASLCPHRP